jgi:hypothetical protein
MGDSFSETVSLRYFLPGAILWEIVSPRQFLLDIFSREPSHGRYLID